MSNFWMPDDMENYALHHDTPIPQHMLNYARRMLKINRIVAIGFDGTKNEWVCLGYQFTKRYLGKLEI